MPLFSYNMELLGSEIKIRALKANCMLMYFFNYDSCYCNLFTSMCVRMTLRCACIFRIGLSIMFCTQ